MNVRKPFDLYSSYAGAYKGAILEKKYLNMLEKRVWSQVSSDKKDYEKVETYYMEQINNEAVPENITVTDSNTVELKPTILQSASQLYERIHNFFFRNIFWLVLFAVVFSISLYKLFKSKFTDIDALVFFLLGVMYLSNAVFISLVQSSIERYSYNIEFVLFFSLPFLFILLRNNAKPSARNVQESEIENFK